VENSQKRSWRVKNKRNTAFLFLALATAVPPAQAVIVRGMPSCGTWVQTRQAGDMASIGNRLWLIGFLSGVAAGTQKDLLKTTDNDSITLWMDNYCRANPLNDLEDGAETLAKELMKRKGL
jgi:hypothetical protein